MLLDKEGFIWLGLCMCINVEVILVTDTFENSFHLKIVSYIISIYYTEIIYGYIQKQHNSSKEYIFLEGKHSIIVTNINWL